MFKISPIQDKQEQKEIATSLGLEFLPDAFGVSMRDNDSGELMGFCQFDILKDAAIIANLVPTEKYSEDFEAMFILGRATMNLIDSFGIHICRAKDGSSDERLLRAIGFRRTEDGFFVDMTGFFEGNCSGHH